MRGSRTNPSRSSIFESRLEKGRQNDDRKDNIAKYLKEDGLASEANSFLDRSDAYRRKREAEQQIISTFRREEADKQGRIRRAAELAYEEDKWLARTLEEHDVGERKEDRVISQLINDSPELRSLRQKLQMAEISKQRHEQVLEKRLLEIEEAARNATYHKVMEENIAEQKRKESEQQQQRHIMQIISKQSLDKQLLEKEHLKQRQHEEKLQEHELMEKLVAEVQDEFERGVQTKLAKKEEHRKYVADYLQQQARLKLKKKREEQEAERQIIEYQRMIEQRLADKEAKQKQKKEEADRIYAVLSAGKLEEQRRKEELEKTINDYFFEVAEAQYQQRQKELQIQREQVRDNLRAASEIYQNLKEKRRLDEISERERFRKQMLDEMAEAHKLEQLSIQKRRMKVEEHKREVERLWNEKQEAYQLQLEEAARIQRKEEEEAIMKEAAIERERQRLLAEHGRRLADYLPPGTLKKPEDFKIVGLKH